MSKSRSYFSVIAVAALAPFLMAAADVPDDEGTRLSINATGAARQDTRVISMEAGVSNRSTSPAQAWEFNAEAISKLKAQLAQYGVADADVRTTNLDLHPTEWMVGDKRIKGFEVRHQLTVIFLNIKNSGPILDALVAAGANQVNGPRFSWEATEEAATTARAAAVREANERARFYADQLGLKIKRIVSIRDSSGYASGSPIIVTGSRIGTQIAPGEDKVRVSIQAEYELGQ